MLYGDQEQCRHEWSKWEDFEEGGLLVFLRGPSQGRVEFFSRDKQRRTCQKCGQREENVLGHQGWTP